MRIAKLIFLLPLVLTAGCAAGYDAYPCGRVNSAYCPPPPLPWTNYATGNCTLTNGRISVDNLRGDDHSFIVSEYAVNPSEYNYFGDGSATEGGH